MANDYDRILRENIGAILLSVSRQYFGFNIVASRDIPGKLHKTIEREPDFVKIVRTDDAREFILHLEFQLTNDPNMMARMRTYHALLAEKFRMKVRQFVLYMGRAKPSMETKIPVEEVMTGFHMLDLQRMDADLFLRSEIPEEIILAVLADFKGRKTEAVIRLIVSRLKQVASDDQQLMKVLQQLGILSRISKLDKKVQQVIKEMPIAFDITQDALYLEGMEKGIERGRERGLQEGGEQIALKMLRMGTFSNEVISEATGVPIDRVQELKQSLIH